MTDSDTLSAVERWFRSRGIPHVIDHYSASRDVFTRVLAPLTAILFLELVTALDTCWPWWPNLGVAAGGQRLTALNTLVVNLALLGLIHLDVSHARLPITGWAAGRLWRQLDEVLVELRQPFAVRAVHPVSRPAAGA